MTENEAIQRLEFDQAMILFDPTTGEEITLEILKALNKDNYLSYVADAVAIKALKEVQQYREIGTVEELSRSKKYIDLAKKHGTIGKMIDECAAYEEIGTVEECRKAMEKQKAEKPEIYTDTIQTISSSFNRDVYLCSRCGQFIGNIDDELPRYCNCCGQRIDEDLEGMENE